MSTTNKKKVNLLTGYRIDAVDAFAILLLAFGILLLAWGVSLEPFGSFSDFLLRHYSEWTPGFVTDGILLLVVNRIIRRNERRRVISQVGSLSNEFALDAVRRIREESWLNDGSLAGQDFSRAKLQSADLSDSDMEGTNFSFADLRDANMTHANLKNANMSGANLTGADLRWSILDGAKLPWADLRLARVEGASLENIETQFAAVDEELAQLEAFAGTVSGGHLSEEEIALVRGSFEHVLVVGEPAIAAFYTNLFKAVPEVRPLFANNTDRQVRKFFQSLKLIVASLDSPEENLLVLRRLGERHRGYGVKPEYYAQVGTVLVDTLQDLLGDNFNDEVRSAWLAAYTLISSVMLYADETQAGP